MIILFEPPCEVSIYEMLYADYSFDLGYNNKFDSHLKNTTVEGAWEDGVGQEE